MPNKKQITLNDLEDMLFEIDEDALTIPELHILFCRSGGIQRHIQNPFRTETERIRSADDGID